ncbi:hypothetical protein H8959_001101 [Pygathrix nigripes]
MKMNFICITCLLRVLRGFTLNPKASWLPDLIDQRRKPTDLITCYLALVHLVLLLIVIFLASPDLFESLYFQRDFKWKAFFYMHRVMGSLSICTTCLLSMSHVVAVSPGTSWSATSEQKFTGYIFHSFFLWVLSSSLSSNLLSSTVVSSNGSNMDMLSISKYSSLSSISYSIKSLYFMLPLFMNVFFVAIMLLSSAYMVILLSRHQRPSQYLHRTNLSPRTSPEKRATQTILLLEQLFVRCLHLQTTQKERNSCSNPTPGKSVHARKLQDKVAELIKQLLVELCKESACKPGQEVSMACLGFTTGDTPIKNSALRSGAKQHLP